MYAVKTTYYIQRPGKGLTPMSIKPWMLRIVWFILIVLTASATGLSVFLWCETQDADRVITQTTLARKALAEQTFTANHLKQRIGDIQNEIQRVKRFNTKLSNNLNLNPEAVVRGEAMGSIGIPSIPADTVSYPAADPFSRRVRDFLDALSDEIHIQEIRQQRLASIIQNKKHELDARPSIWPAMGRITSDFGVRRSPFSRRYDFHNGIDIKLQRGTPVKATAPGVVTHAGYLRGYGQLVVLQHENGIETAYGHLKKSLVKVGDTIKRGQTIALSGNSGRSTGPHLHYEVRVANAPVDPMNFILD
ncbi:M23 family metallopeptidase [Desulfovibrio inopinatus]|uniref:M23 family metallopeptidase n=1 Tax=Desulfovibrio inopinatus TaxID=102109 RepID=UPI000426BBE1|nr:M23 family metallopeptidase [Desulfovibrio inopinatus]